MRLDEVEGDTLTVVQAAEILGIGIGGAYTAVRNGEIPAVRVGGRWLVSAARLRSLLTEAT